MDVEPNDAYDVSYMGKGGIMNTYIFFANHNSEVEFWISYNEWSNSWDTPNDKKVI